MKPNTHSRRKAFPKTLSWFLYEVQCHTRWACTLGSLQNLTLNTPNKPKNLLVEIKMLCLSWAGCPSFNTVDVNQREKRHGEKVEWIRQSWPLFMREGYLCEQGERSSLGYEAADVWCWQETLTFGVKLEVFFLNDWELEYCSINLCFSPSQFFLLLWWRAWLIDHVETGFLHCCNRSNILT